MGDAIFRGAPWLVQYFLVQLEGAPPDTGAAPPGFGGCTSFAPVLHPPALAVHPFCTPLAPSKVLDFGILPMYLSFQVHLWSSVLWMLEEYYIINPSPGMFQEILGARQCENHNFPGSNERMVNVCRIGSKMALLGGLPILAILLKFEKLPKRLKF